MSYRRYHVVFEVVIDFSVAEGEDPEKWAIVEARDLINDPSFEPAKVEDWSDDLPADLHELDGEGAE